LVERNSVPIRKICGLILRYEHSSAVLCDAATEDHGKINLLGAFDTIQTLQLPAVHRNAPLRCASRSNPGDEGPHKLKLKFRQRRRPQASCLPLNIPVAVALPDDVHFLTRNFHHQHPTIEVRRGGLYSVDVRLDDKSQAAFRCRSSTCRKRWRDSFMIYD